MSEKRETARQFAERCGIEVIGKLSHYVKKYEEWDYIKCEMVQKSDVIYIDEAGNEFIKGEKGWCLVTADGAVY